ncbi:DNA helicase, partial [Kipferlia bialata]|eukprot:g10914.t1
MQLVLTGDFLQLPPVNKKEKPRYCFQADMWEECAQNTVLLTQILRQKDQGFKEMLDEMRLGNVTDEAVAMIKKRIKPMADVERMEDTIQRGMNVKYIRESDPIMYLETLIGMGQEDLHGIRVRQQDRRLAHLTIGGPKTAPSAWEQDYVIGLRQQINSMLAPLNSRRSKLQNLQHVRRYGFQVIKGRFLRLFPMRHTCAAENARLMAMLTTPEVHITSH